VTADGTSASGAGGRVISTTPVVTNAMTAIPLTTQIAILRFRLLFSATRAASRIALRREAGLGVWTMKNP
jgi:hypothetical protein